MNTTPPSAASAELAVDYFDGHSARARPVRLQIVGRTLHIRGEGVDEQVPVRQVSWPERSRHGQRQAYLPRHGLLSSADAPAWDAWAAAQGLGPGWLVRWTLSWRGVLAATLLLCATVAAGWAWGLPAAARAVLAFTPASIDSRLGDTALENFEQRLLQPSALPAARQEAIRTQFAQTVQRAHPRGGAPAYTLHFRAAPGGRGGLGANAFALPGGHIVLTDALALLLIDRPEVLMGVLGHELGHLQHRHGMRMLVQGSLLAGVSALVLGDVSSVLAAAPVLLGQAAYSRDFEFEADAAAARLMRANGWRPGTMAVLFERLRQPPGGTASGSAKGADKGASQPADGDLPLPALLRIGLASHPPDAERIRRMEEVR